MQQHTAFPTRKITMSDTQLTQEERYHIQDLSCHHTIIEGHPITLPFAATSLKIKATAALCGNISEYAANPTANDKKVHGHEAKCMIASAWKTPLHCRAKILHW